MICKYSERGSEKTCTGRFTLDDGEAEVFWKGDLL